MRKRIMSLALVLVMLLSLMPAFELPARAAYEDGDECWNCGHYHWDEYMHECGACSPSCTNDWCALETHCHRCGECLNGDYPCDECGLCKDCMDEIGHCSQCDMCWMDNGGNDVLCGNCGRCEFCSVICPECGMCEDCASDPSDGMHCPECGNCYQITQQCAFIENNHCKECCEPCEQCGECVWGDALETCPYCGLCVECCEFNSMMEGCEDGSICIYDSSEWDEHVCGTCMNFFQSTSDLCDTCVEAGEYRCKECCEAASECSDYMCEYDDEYEEHFCIDCGECFHDVTLCDTCAGAGEYRCEDCCGNLTNSLGCDGSCGDVWCSNDAYFEQHLEEEHEDYPDFDDHDAFPSNRWSHDKNSHWRECRLCDEDENEELWESHRAGLAAHSYDSNGVCTVCGYSAGNKLYIARQPRDARCVTSIYSSGYEEDPANGLFHYGDNNKVTFSVTVKGGKGSYWYEWYRMDHGKPWKLADIKNGQFGGVDTATLTVKVSSEACSEQDLLYYCVVTDGETTVTTEKAIIKASHAYSDKYATNTEAKKPESASYRAVTLTYLKDGGSVTVTAPASDGHRYQCLCEYDKETLHFKSKTSAGHTFGTAKLLGQSAKAGATENDKVYEKTCTACGYTTYYETHQHIYHTEESDPEKYNRGTFQVDEEKTTNMAHAMVCLVDGCGHIQMESHEWDWRHMGYGSDAEGGGIFYRECRICGYPDYDYRPVDEGGNKVNWTTKNVLVTAINAQVSRTLAVEGDRLTLTINHNSYTQGKRCTGWTVEYTTSDGIKHDITSAYTITQNEEGAWGTVIKLAGYTTGGILIFTPTMEICTSHEYVTEGYVAPACMYDGFAGYRVCKYCHAADPTDTRSDEERVIPATGSDHTGTKQPLYQKEVTLPSGQKTITWTTDKSESNGKRYNYKEGSCTEKGCEGDFLCSACGRVIPGKWEYNHSDELDWIGEIIPTCGRDGYQGDGHCKNCGKFVRKGYVTEMGKGHAGPIFYDYDHNAVDPTCTTAGKTSEQYCYTCMETVADGLPIAPLGHKWVEDEENSTDETIAYKCDRTGCAAQKFERKNAPSPKPSLIMRVVLEVEVPAVGAPTTTPPTIKLPADANYNLVNAFWDTEDETFETGSYTVTIRLEATDGYRFNSATLCKVNGKNVTGTSGESQELTITATVTVKPADGRTSITYPKVNEDLIYNGMKQVGVEEGVGYTLYGARVESDADIVYTVTAALKDGYVWADGSDGIKKITWEIFPAAQDAPGGLEFVADDTMEGNIGKITGITDVMEYLAPDAPAWCPVAVGSTELPVAENAAGNYLFRFKEVLNSEGSGRNLYASPVALIAAATGEEPVTPPEEYYALTVIGGSGSGLYKGGDEVHITANGPEDTEIFGAFSHWKFSPSSGFMWFNDDDTESVIAGLYMPGHDLKATAVYNYRHFTVTFDAGEGAASFTEAETGDDGTLSDLPAAIRDDYRFNGWYTASGELVTSGTVFAADTTVYARWTYIGGFFGGFVSESYAITVKDAKNGNVTADRKSASAGTTVTITVKPDSGYELGDLTVTDAKDKTIKLTDKGNGKYTFTMPSSKVTVEASFSKIRVENPFADVKPGSYYEDAVIWAVGKGITGGTSATTFDPDAPCSRAQAVTFLWRAAGSPAPKNTTMLFTDVPVGSYYYDAVLWAVENGITNGTSATTFGPSESCNRAQIVTFLWRAQKSPAAAAANPFTDVAADAYYTNAVLWAVKEGVTAGTTATTFSPAADCTRAQIVTFIYRALAD